MSSQTVAGILVRVFALPTLVVFGFVPAGIALRTVFDRPTRRKTAFLLWLARNDALEI